MYIYCLFSAKADFSEIKSKKKKKKKKFRTSDSSGRAKTNPKGFIQRRINYYVALALLRLGIFFRSCKSERKEKKTERADKKGKMFVDNTGLNLCFFLV